MWNNLIQIADFIVGSFLHTWPYLLVTIPIAVAVKMSGASKYITHAFTARPVVAIFLATLVGAFSPLCSCSVIPVVASLLIGGVPLAPVMSFWLASPSMDPEIFFLTVSSLGWELAIWRMATTLAMSLSGGFVTHYLVERNWLGTNILRDMHSTKVITAGDVIRKTWQSVLTKLSASFAQQKTASLTIHAGTIPLHPQQNLVSYGQGSGCSRCEGSQTLPIRAKLDEPLKEIKSSFWKRLALETWEATAMVIKFMLLAWFLGALIRLYVPETWVVSTLGGNKPGAVISAALLGIPVYTSNLAAMPIVGGLLAQGMNPGAALAFLISGPTTTLPAMSAVWGLVNQKVFALYIGFSLVGAVVAGFVYSIVQILLSA